MVYIWYVIKLAVIVCVGVTSLKDIDPGPGHMAVALLFEGFVIYDFCFCLWAGLDTFKTKMKKLRKRQDILRALWR